MAVKQTKLLSSWRHSGETGVERSVVILNRGAKEGPTNKVILEQKMEGANYMDIWGDAFQGEGTARAKILSRMATWNLEGLTKRSVWLE